MGEISAFFRAKKPKYEHQPSGTAVPMERQTSVSGSESRTRSEYSLPHESRPRMYGQSATHLVSESRRTAVKHHGRPKPEEQPSEVARTRRTSKGASCFNRSPAHQYSGRYHNSTQGSSSLRFPDRSATPDSVRMALRQTGIYNGIGIAGKDRSVSREPIPEYRLAQYPSSKTGAQNSHRGSHIVDAEPQLPRIIRYRDQGVMAQVPGTSPAAEPESKSYGNLGSISHDLEQLNLRLPRPSRSSVEQLRATRTEAAEGEPVSLHKAQAETDEKAGDEAPHHNTDAREDYNETAATEEDSQETQGSRPVVMSSRSVQAKCAQEADLETDNMRQPPRQDQLAIEDITAKSVDKIILEQAVDWEGRYQPHRPASMFGLKEFSSHKASGRLGSVASTSTGNTSMLAEPGSWLPQTVNRWDGPTLHLSSSGRRNMTVGYAFSRHLSPPLGHKTQTESIRDFIKRIEQEVLGPSGNFESDVQQNLSSDIASQGLRQPEVRSIYSPRGASYAEGSLWYQSRDRLSNDSMQWRTDTGNLSHDVEYAARQRAMSPVVSHVDDVDVQPLESEFWRPNNFLA
jgi:hypothetical protein